MEEGHRETHRPSPWQIKVGHRLKKLGLGWEELRSVGPFPFGFPVCDQREALLPHLRDLCLDPKCPLLWLHLGLLRSAPLD